MDDTSRNTEFDNFDGQPLYYCTREIFTDGHLVTNNYCLIKCKTKYPEDCIFRHPSDKYVEIRKKSDERN